MKKIFTSISMALCLAASSFNASAQQATQLSDAQKQEIQQKVLPVVFEQIKEQAGIDILGWAQPKLTADYLESLPIFNQLQGNSGLRAATDISVQPDSILINAVALSPDFGGLIGTIKVVFGEYSTFTIPVDINGRTYSIEMPSTISVTSTSPLPEMQNVAEITVESHETEGLWLDTEMMISMWGSETQQQLLRLTVGEDATHVFEFGVTVGEGLKNLWGLLGIVAPTLPTLPDMDYVITADVFGALTSGVLSTHLYGIQQNDETNTRISMGDADVAINIEALMGMTGWPIQYIDITSYKDNVANDWNRLGFNVSQANAQDLVVTISNIGYSSAEKDNATVRDITIITMTDNTVNATNPQSAVQTVVQNVVSQLANEGEAAPYAMTIERITQDANGDQIIDTNDESVPVMDVTVTPSLSATGASATINIKSYSGESTTEVDLIATATTEKVQLDVEMGGSVIGSAYFTSNILEATSNEDIQLANVEVTPVKDGIYVSGTTAASYRIVSMSGATVANGTVSGDNAYISTSALAKGIYVIVVTENGESKAIKFAR